MALAKCVQPPRRCASGSPSASGSLPRAWSTSPPIGQNAPDGRAARGVARLRSASGLHVLGESICPYCGVGCRLRFEGVGAQVLRVRGVESAPANLGGICAKGAQLGPTIHTSDRHTGPQLRLSRRDEFRPTDWGTALAYIGEIVTNTLHTHGPDALAFYGSGQLDTETAYLVTKLFKGHLGCNNT